MNLPEARSDMRQAYRGGAPGILVSSAVWLAAAATAYTSSSQRGVWVLLLGGMLIHPLSVAICKLTGATGAHTKGNPLASLAIATTFWLIFSLPLAYAVSLQRVEWFFPAMLLVIGGRYLTFEMLYGTRVYWLLGMSLAAAGWLLVVTAAPAAVSAAIGAVIEAMFGCALFASHRRSLARDGSNRQAA